MTTLSTTVRARTFVDGYVAQADVEFAWDECDPVAVTITVREGAGFPVQVWKIGRALLASGLGSSKYHVGEGDVLTRSPGGYLSLVLRPPGQVRAHVLMPRRLVEWLISEAESCVASGSSDEADIVAAELEIVLAEMRDVA